MGNKDYWPYSKDFWKNWAEHNKEYWAKFTEQNKDYWAKMSRHNKDYWAKWADHNKMSWNNFQAQAHGYARHCGRGRILGRIIIFGLGFWAGSVYNRTYHRPSAYPRETWEEMKTATEKLKKDNPNFKESSEFREIIEKVKQLEKSYRRQPPAEGSQPSTSDSSPPK